MKFVFIFCMFLSLSANAEITSDEALQIAKVSQNLVTTDIRTVVADTVNPGGPCRLDGNSLFIDVQIRSFKWDHLAEKNVETWKTIKRVNYNRNSGEIIQECKW